MDLLREEGDKGLNQKVRQTTDRDIKAYQDNNQAGNPSHDNNNTSEIIFDILDV